MKRGKQGDLLSPKEGGVLLQGTQDGSLLKFNVYRETFKHKLWIFPQTQVLEKMIFRVIF